MLLGLSFAEPFEEFEDDTVSETIAGLVSDPFGEPFNDDVASLSACAFTDGGAEEKSSNWASTGSYCTDVPELTLLGEVA